MKKTLITLAASGFVFSSTAAFAQNTNQGASDLAPRGKAEAPGQLQKSGEPGDAKNFAPGQMKKETTGSSVTTDTKVKDKAKSKGN